MSGVSGDIDHACEPHDDMATTLSASVELEIPAPHTPKCVCCASLEDALVVIASLRSQLAEAMQADTDRDAFEDCLYGCTSEVTAPRCPSHGTALRHAENPDD